MNTRITAVLDTGLWHLSPRVIFEAQKLYSLNKFTLRRIVLFSFFCYFFFQGLFLLSLNFSDFLLFLFFLFLLFFLLFFPFLFLILRIIIGRVQSFRMLFKTFPLN